MKAILEFNLPEDECQHQIAVNAMGWALVAWDMDQNLRSWQVNGHNFGTADQALDRVRDVLHETLAEYNLSLDMIE